MWWRKLFYYFAIGIAGFLLYQLVLNLLGGSWGVESLLLGFLILTLTITITNVRRLAELEGEFKEFKRTMGELARDFKKSDKEVTSFMYKHDSHKEKSSDKTYKLG